MRLTDYLSEIQILLQVIDEKSHTSFTKAAAHILRSGNKDRRQGWWIALGKLLLSVPGILEQRAWIIDFKLYQSYQLDDLGRALLNNHNYDENILDVDIGDELEQIVSSKISVQMYDKGMSIQEIAIERNIQANTVIKHLLVEQGDKFNYEEHITRDELKLIQSVMKEFPRERNSVWKSKLPDTISYVQIDIARALSR